MASKGTLTVRLIGDAKPLEQTLKGAGSKVGQFAKVAVAAGGAAAVAFGVKALKGAVELNETLSKTEQVFKSASDDVVDFADEMGRAFGLPKQEILDAASNIGLVAKASGLSEKAAADMSTEMAQLAADASSFFNVPLPDALEKIRSGLVGEAEPLRAFGVLLSAAAVEEKALAMGIADAGEELTEQQKVMARSAIITEQMSDASGDLERTSDSLANRWRALKGRAANFAAEVGQKLIPVVTALWDWFDKKLPPVFEAAQMAWKIFSGTLADDPYAEEVAGQMGGIMLVAHRMAEVFAEVRKKVVAAVGAVKAWWDDNGPAVQAAIQAVIEKVLEFGAEVQRFWRETVRPVLAQLKQAWDENADEIGQILVHLGEIVGSLGRIVADVFSEAESDVQDSTGSMSDNIGTTVRAIEGLVSAIATLARWLEVIGEHWGTFEEMLSRAAGPITNMVDAFNAWRDAIHDVRRALGMLEAKQGAKGAFSGKGSLVPRNIPGLAAGGVVKKPTVLMAGEGGESEAIVPLSKLDAMLSNSGGGGGGTVNNYYTLNAPNYVGAPQELLSEMKRLLARDARNGGTVVARVVTP